MFKKHIWTRWTGESVSHEVDAINATITQHYTREGVTTTTIYQLADLLAEFFGFDKEAAAFVAEWHPEAAYIVADYFQHDISWGTIKQISEAEWAADLEWEGVTEDYYTENYGTVLRDAAFPGVIVFGE